MNKGCIFDLDGTLVDSLEDLALATNRALERLGYQPYPLEKYKMFVGSGVKKLIERCLPDETKERQALALDYFYEEYSLCLLEHTKPYLGIEEVLKYLKQQGSILAVVTNKPDPLAKKIVSTLFENLFDEVCGQVEGILVKPDPTLVLQILDHYDLDKAKTFYIGDSDVDIYTAKNASLISIGCTWGNRSEEELVEAGACFIVHDPKEISKVVCQDDRC